MCNIYIGWEVLRMKIQIFSDSNVNSLEDGVNKFIKDKDIIDIKQSQSAVTDYNVSNVNVTITVMYK